VDEEDTKWVLAEEEVGEDSMAYKQKPPLFFKTSIKGYRKDSPDKNEPQLKIPSNKITMKGVDHKVHGKDNLGNEKIMKPGKNYEFPGDYVIETPLAQHQTADLIGSEGGGGTKDKTQSQLLLDRQKEKLNKTGTWSDTPIQSPTLQVDCDERFKGSCKPTRKQKRKSNKLRRKKKGTNFRSRVNKVTDFIGLTDHEDDGTIISRAVDKRKDKRTRIPDGYRANPNWHPNCGCVKFLPIKGPDIVNPRELNDRWESRKKWVKKWRE